MKKVKNLILHALLLTAPVFAEVDKLEENNSMAGTFFVDLNRLYNEQFSYSLPKSILVSYLSGKAFDHPKEYSKKEIHELYQDIKDVKEKIFVDGLLNRPIAVMTAGAPGAGKTMLMEQDLAKRQTMGENFAYIDPDAICLKSMERTYKQDIEKDPSVEGRLAAYNKWRPASNGINHLVLASLIKDKLAFYFGTTSTGPATYKFFELLKNQGYYINLLHVSAEDDVRFASIQERDKTFIQTTESDTREKGLLLPQRINDTFLKYADRIDFYWRNGVHEEAKLAAIWTRNEEDAETLGRLEIIDRNLYENIKRVHNAAANSLQRSDLDWDESVEACSTLIAW